jgi:hypothetical protein
VKVPKRTRILQSIAKVLSVASIVFLIASLVLRIVLGLLFQTPGIASLLSGFGLRARADPIYDIRGRIQARREAEKQEAASLDEAEHA